MESLPPEIILTILEYCVANHYGDKNSLLTLRAVCKLFDHILKPIVLQTLQLEFTRLDRISRSCRPPDEAALQRIGHLCQALYLDLMMIRDDGEVRYLGKIFSKIPTMNVFIDTLHDRYCMTEASFTEIEYRARLGSMLALTPNVSAVRLNLPFQLISRHCRAATMILGNTIEALAERARLQRLQEQEGEVEEPALVPLRTLVVENLTDTTVVKLWHNPRDVRNIMDVFAGLEHLILSVRRHEEGLLHTVTFRNRLWEMIGKAPELRSLCLVGLDLDEKGQQPQLSASSSSPSTSTSAAPAPPPVRTSTQRDLSLEEWQFRSVPTIRRPPRSALPHLACIELRRVEVMGRGLLAMFRCFAASLRELYLDHVYLKTVHSGDDDDGSGGGGGSDNTLWVGLPNTQPPPNHRWMAVLLRQLLRGGRLRVCRASNLGYDQYVTGIATAVGGGTFVTATNTVTPAYDLRDPSGLDRPLGQRLVEAVLGCRQPDAPDGSPVEYHLPPDDYNGDADEPWALGADPGQNYNHDHNHNVNHNQHPGDVTLSSTTPVPPLTTSNGRPHDGSGDSDMTAVAETKSSTTTTATTAPKAHSTSSPSSPSSPSSNLWWSAEHYLDTAPHAKNPTSGWQRNGIDGRFPNCNPFTLHELQHIADTALEGMSLVQLLEGSRCGGGGGGHSHLHDHQNDDDLDDAEVLAQFELVDAGSSDGGDLEYD
ncbi:hypothetical protein SLS62_000116 [Diatrype stigma]|uniref:F-box domain-containing protein n=1 Tax=Diatrype stigma TaxID=117547 RepID=A0AAN9V0D6_9PEZI